MEEHGQIVDYLVKMKQLSDTLSLKELLRGQKIGPDIIVLDPHAGQAERKGVKRVSGKNGSAVEGIIRYQPCPIMIVNRVVSAEMVGLSRIMISVDFSESCRYALDFSNKLAKKYDSKLYVFHMLGVPPSPGYFEAAYEADVQALQKELIEFCSKIQQFIVGEFRIW